MIKRNEEGEGLKKGKENMENTGNEKESGIEHMKQKYFRGKRSMIKK